MSLQNIIKEYKFKIETHAHTNPMSPCASSKPDETILRYKEAGFDAVTITNHFCNHSFCGDNFETVKKRFLLDFYTAKNQGEKCGVKVILGMEIRFDNNGNDYLIYGLDENDLNTLFDLTRTDYATFYKNFKNDKNVILQAHPFRDGMHLENPDYLDGIECFNMHPYHNSRIGLAVKYAKEHPHFITTSGSDAHHDKDQGLGGILSKTLPENSFDLAKILKSRDYLLNVAGSVVIP